MPLTIEQKEGKQILNFIWKFRDSNTGKTTLKTTKKLEGFTVSEFSFTFY